MSNTHKWGYRLMGAIHFLLSLAMGIQGQMIECAGAFGLGMIHLALSTCDKKKA